MSFVGRYSSNYDVGRHDSGAAGVRTSTTHFYTPSRQNVQTSYGRGSSSGPGSTSQTSRFSLVQKKPTTTETTELRQSFSRNQTQSASKYPSYDYSQRRLVDLGIGQLGEAAKTSTYSKPYYRTSGTSEFSQYNSLDRPSSTYMSKYSGVANYSRYTRDEDFKRKITDTPVNEKEDSKFRESISTFGTTLPKEKETSKISKSQLGGNFEESKQI